MATQIVGRTACPECGFGSAHVKRSDRCLYRYCPECGSQYMARGSRLEGLLMAKTRPVDQAVPEPAATGSASDAPATGSAEACAPAPAAPPATATPVVTPPAAPAPAPRRRGLFG